MSNLKNNTAELNKILAAVNALPEAGSGEAPAPVLQEKSVTPSKEAQSVTPDTGYDGLSKVSVGAIPDEYIVPSGMVNVTENGEYNVREAEKVNVNVPIPEFTTQEKTVTPSEETQNIEPDDDHDGLSKVTVNPIPEEYIIPSGTISITENGVHNVREVESVNVNVPSSDGGGLTAETCNVQLNFSSEKNYESATISYVGVDSGVVEQKFVDYIRTDKTFIDVLRWSLVYVYLNGEFDTPNARTVDVTNGYVIMEKDGLNFLIELAADSGQTITISLREA